MAKRRHDIIAALDIGTTKVACFIAQVQETGELKIIGIGHQLSQGIRSGVITDIRAAENSIVAAVHAAEQMADETIDQVIISLSGAKLSSHNIHVEVPLSTHAITARDIQQVITHGKNSQSTPEREVIHCIPISYSIDEARGIQDPRGMYGNRFGADLHIITASASAVKNIVHCVARCQLDVTDCVVAPYASGLSTLTEDEMNLGVTLIDVGGASTSVAVFVEGKMIYTDVVPLGSMHVTSDLAKGLSTGIPDAERIKALYGNVIAGASDDQKVIEVMQLSEDGEEITTPVPRSMLVNIIRPRIEEIFEMIRARLEENGFDRIAGRRLVLTGGGSQLVGLSDLATQVFNKQVRLGRPKAIRGMAEATGGAPFATCVGLLEYAWRDVDVQRQVATERETVVNGVFGRAFGWMKEYL